MNKYSVILSLLLTVAMVTAANGQVSSSDHLIKKATGTVLNTDAVGNIISIRTDAQVQMSFTVPDKALITQETHNIGLMDIGEASLVTIQYYVSSSLKNIVVSIVDNESVVNE